MEQLELKPPDVADILAAVAEAGSAENATTIWRAKVRRIL
jgi:hypothetical protein